MATVRVLPLPDGTDQRSSWQVQKSGRRVSTHVKKTAALREAKRAADSGDSVYIHGTNGEVLDERTRR